MSAAPQSRHLLEWSDAHGCTDESPQLAQATMHATCLHLTVRRVRDGQHVVEGTPAQVAEFRAWLSQQRNTALSLVDMGEPSQ